MDCQYRSFELSQVSVAALNVGEHTLPIGLVAHHEHVVHLQQRCDVCALFGRFKCDLKVLSSVLWIQRIEIEGVWKVLVNERTEC